MLQLRFGLNEEFSQFDESLDRLSRVVVYPRDPIIRRSLVTTQAWVVCARIGGPCLVRWVLAVQFTPLGHSLLIMIGGISGTFGACSRRCSVDRCTALRRRTTSSLGASFVFKCLLGCALDGDRLWNGSC